MVNGSSQQYLPFRGIEASIFIFNFASKFAYNVKNRNMIIWCHRMELSLNRRWIWVRVREGVSVWTREWASAKKERASKKSPKTFCTRSIMDKRRPSWKVTCLMFFKESAGIAKHAADGGWWSTHWRRVSLPKRLHVNGNTTKHFRRKPCSGQCYKSSTIVITISES